MTAQAATAPGQTGTASIGAARTGASADDRHNGPPAPSDTWLPGPASYPPENGLALSPPMGFNDWAHYGCDINQQLFVNTANALVATGLAKDGYRYVNIDDCWPAMSRNAQGQLVANPTLFPKGDTSANAAIRAHDAGFSINPQGYLLDNLWTYRVTETASVIAANIPAHGVVMYRVTPAVGAHRSAPAAVLSISNPPLVAGKPTPVTVTLTDNGLLPLQDTSISLSPPAGWSARATSATSFGVVQPGLSVTASYSEIAA
jgi:hypothetical protein